METAELKAWAESEGALEIDVKQDGKLSISSKLLRFRWHGAPAVGVGAEHGADVRINSLIDGLAWFIGTAHDSDEELNILLGFEAGEALLIEHVDAIGTLCACLEGGPRIRVWAVSADAGPVALPTGPSSFGPVVPTRWNHWLIRASDRTVDGLAAQVAALVEHPSFSIYPKLSKGDEVRPWQMRLDGLDIGRVGASSAVLQLDTSNPDADRHLHKTWKELVGTEPRQFDVDTRTELVALISTLIAAWQVSGAPDAVLGHGQAEHALEAHLLTGRLEIQSAIDGPLSPAIPVEGKAVRGAQFPTLWGDVSSPARYLDVLLRDDVGNPFAVELKDQDAGGGHGQYLRHGLTQAVLYRHFIRSASELDPLFDRFGLRRDRCRAVLAFPAPTLTVRPKVETKLARHRELAGRFGVEVIEFARPGSTL